MTQTPFELIDISSGYDQKKILEHIHLSIPKGKISVIIGANACGKTTLLKTMSRLIKPMNGHVMLGNKNVHKMQPKELSRVLGILPQTPVIPEGITVSELISRGRFPHQSLFKGLNKEDFRCIEDAMHRMGLSELSNRYVNELSGGQRQRVWIAMALAQRTDILLLDEPTTYLDIAHQVEILDMLTDINREYQTTIVMVLHDINLSVRYADHIFAVSEGNIVASGNPKQILSPSLIEKVFDMKCVISTDPVSNSPYIIPIGRHHNKTTSYH